MGSFYDLLLASKLSGGGGGGGGTITGDKFWTKYTAAEKMEISEAHTVKSNTFGGNFGGTALCLWNATGAEGQYTAQNYMNGCQNVVTVVAPKIRRCCVGIIGNCANLEAIDFSSVTTIDMNSLANNAKFNTLILRGGSVATLSNVNAFNNTPFKSGGTGGTLYVPNSLKSQYEAASNWSTILGYTDNQIKSIEDSIYKTQYADGTPIS